MKIILKPGTSEVDVKAMCSGVVTALNGLESALPQSLRSLLKETVDNVNGALSKLPPLDQVPAATEAAWMLNHFTGVITSLEDLSTKLAQALTSQLATAKNEFDATLPDLLKTKVETDIAAGTLFTKAQLDAAVSAAEASTRTTALNDFKRTDTRKGLITAAGLPVPSDDALLSAEESVFTPKLDAAKANAGQLTGMGYSLQSAPGLFDLVWNDTQFKPVVQAISAKAGAGDPLVPPGDKPDPSQTRKPGYL